MHPPMPPPPATSASSSVGTTTEQRPGTTRRRLKIMPSPSDGLSAAHARAWPLTTSMMWWHGADVRRSAPHAHALMTPLMTQRTGGDHPTRQVNHLARDRGAPFKPIAQRGAPGVTDGWGITMQPVRKSPIQRLSDRAVRHRALRREAIKRLGGCCIKCGSTQELELDHIDPFTRTDQRHDPCDSRPKLEAELPLLQLLCLPCHVEKSRRDRAQKQPGGAREYWEHGTLYGYYYKRCGCPTCMAAMRAYSRSRREKARQL